MCGEEHGIWVFSKGNRNLFRHFYDDVNAWTVFNTFVALVILTLTALLSEHLIRRRGRAKQEVEA